MKDKKIAVAYLYDGKYFNIPDEEIVKLDYINYSFATIDTNTHQLNLDRLTKLKEVLKYRELGVGVSLAIGGWGADGFSQALRTAEKRQVLITSILNTLQKYQFDGIDLDWEYPTRNTGGIASSLNDRNNLNLFVKDLKAAMINLRPDLLLTIAVISGDSASSIYDIKNLEPYIDYFNIMTYDGGSASLATHHTNLFNYRDEGDSIASSVQLYRNLGVPNDKIIIGAAFYGHLKTMTITNDMIIGSPTINNKTIDYTTITKFYLNNPQFTRYFDEQALAPYLTDGTTFVSYDDHISIAHKCQYVEDENLAGLMFWELGSDQSFTLLTTINQAFNKK